MLSTRYCPRNDCNVWFYGETGTKYLWCWRYWIRGFAEFWKLCSKRPLRFPDNIKTVFEIVVAQGFEKLLPFVKYEAAKVSDMLNMSPSEVTSAAQEEIANSVAILSNRLASVRNAGSVKPSVFACNGCKCCTCRHGAVDFLSSEEVQQWFGNYSFGLEYLLKSLFLFLSISCLDFFQYFKMKCWGICLGGSTHSIVWWTVPILTYNIFCLWSNYNVSNKFVNFKFLFLKSIFLSTLLWEEKF